MPRNSTKPQDTTEADEWALYGEQEYILQCAGQSVPLVKIDDFCRHWLPKVPDLPEATVLNIIDRITHGPAYKARRWTAFAKKPSRRYEEIMCKGFTRIVGAVRQAASKYAPQLQETTSLVSAPTQPPVSTTWRNLARPSAYFVFKDPQRYSPGKPSSWFDIVAAGEFETRDAPEELYESISKSLWNMHHTNREDARRQCVFAFTIKDYVMQFWFADHSTVAVSDGFNIMEKPEHLIRFILAFSYAPLENFGFDPTVVADWDGDSHSKPQYLITVNSRVKPGVIKRYKTVKELAAPSGEALRGRCTRVWVAREWVDGDMVGDECVLKDCWVDLKRDLEGEKMDQVKESANTEEDKKKLSEVLLTLLIDGFVLRPDGTVNQTLDGPLRKRLITGNPRSQPTVALYYGYSTVGLPDDAVPSEEVIPIGPRITHEPKKRYRIVYAEVCQPYCKMNFIEDRMRTLSRASLALAQLHKLGWVHHDISSGNIMLHGDTVKIADLEYAQKLNKTGAGEKSTGTHDYMALEVQDREYYFRPSPHRELSPASDSDSDTSALSAAQRSPNSDLLKRIEDSLQNAPRKILKMFRSPSPPPQDTPWFYNPLHDMESIAWIAWKTVIANDIAYNFPKGSRHETYEEGIEDCRERLALAAKATRKLFQGRMDRFIVIATERNLYYTVAECIHPLLRPAIPTFARLRETLVRAYREVEKDTATIDHTCADGVHDVFAKLLKDVADYAKRMNCDMRIQSLSEAERLLEERCENNNRVAKRGREEDDAGNGRRCRRKANVPKSTRILRSHTKKAAGLK